MLVVVVAAFAVVVILILCSSRLSRRGNAKDMGWMSEQWLAEYRASHPL
jgi:hypothetical protein